MKTKRYAPAIRDSIAIFAKNGIKLQELANGQWQTVEKSVFSGETKVQTFRSWMGACDAFAWLIRDDALYAICAGLPGVEKTLVIA